MPSVELKEQESLPSVIEKTTDDCSEKGRGDKIIKLHRFGSRTTALEVLEDVDLSGKVALITGTNSGIGRETARALALRGAHVVMANRNLVDSEKFRDELIREKADARIDIIHIDLSSLHSVRNAANEFLAKRWPINMLILNAGVFAPIQKTTADGFEMAFGVNHLGHFYLTVLLLDWIRKSAPARIVIVSSRSHNHTGLTNHQSLDEKVKRLIPPSDCSQISYRLYANSKLCNVLMAMKLHRMEYNNGIHLYVLHPGTAIATGISRGFGFISKVVGFLTKPITKSLQQGAATTVYCAASGDTENDSGKYYDNCWDDEEGLSKELAHDEDLQDAVWQKSMEIIKKFEAEHPDSEH